MIYIGMDVHQQSTTFCLFDPAPEEAGRYRTMTRPTTAEGIGEILAPLDRQCQVAFEVGTQERPFRCDCPACYAVRRSGQAASDGDDIRPNVKTASTNHDRARRRSFEHEQSASHCVGPKP